LGTLDRRAQIAGLVGLLAVRSLSACSSPAPPRNGGDAPNGVSDAGHCDDLVVVSANGVFLGRATSDPTAADGVCNASGEYGNEFMPLSVFNTSNVYGGAYSPEGAYNASARVSPLLLCRTTGLPMGSITKNRYLANPIDPDELCASLAGAGY
jgi:hypothetical protein